MNKYTLQQLILSGSERYLDPTIIDRKLSISFMRDKATVITGARRIGKTSAIRGYLRNLVKNGIEEKKICYIHLFDDMFADESVTVSEIVDAYYSLYPELYKDEGVYFVFDEVEMLKSWGAGIAGLIDTHHPKILLTGSSGKMLSEDMGTELRGRALEYPYFPLSFSEFLSFNDVRISNTNLPLKKEDELIVKKWFSEFMERGTYPECARVTDASLRAKIFASYFDAMYSRDIMERFEVGKGSLLRTFMRRMLKTSGQPITISKIMNNLKSSGYSISRPTIIEYINMMKSAAILSEVQILKEEKTSDLYPKKYYAVDFALSSSFTPYSEMTGVKAEHIVYSCLHRRGLPIFYYRTLDDYETDFIVTDEYLSPLQLIQVSINLEENREREIRGLLKTMEELNRTEGYILTLDDYEDIAIEDKRIYIRPIWMFLLKEEYTAIQ